MDELIEKWNWLPLAPGTPGTGSSPYPQSSPSRPNIGRKTRMPKPTERYTSNGLTFCHFSQSFPAYMKASP